jgi:hypothetical protein
MTRFGRLLRFWTRGLAGAHLVVALAAGVLCLVPLFDLLGFEFAAAIGWVLAYVSGWRACAAAVDARGTGRDSFPGDALLRVTISNLSLVVAPLAVISLHAFRVPTCNWSTGLAFYALFPIPAVLYGTTLGFGLGLVWRLRRARLAFVLWSIATYAVAIALLLIEPPKFAFNAFVGYFPGPIYDSNVSIGHALLIARATVLLEAALFALLAALGWNGTRWSARDLHRRWRGDRALLGMLAIATVALLALVTVFRAPLGVSIDRGFIQRTLGGHVRTEHFDIYFDRGSMTDERADRLATEHETRYAQLAGFFGLEPRHRIRSYVYASAAQKKRLMGAAGTSFEDALHDEFHINASSADPQPALTHEMAHIFAAQIDPWVPVCWKIGIHEGIAVAAEWDEECARLELTPDQACAAMDSLRLLPDLQHSLSATGFWSQAGSRVYTACGSFVRFLVDTRGMDRFRVLWRRGDFEKAYGVPLSDLVTEWRAKLARTPLDAEAMRRAELLYRPPAIFALPCAHELARLDAEAAAALGRGDAATAESLQVRLLEIDDRNMYRWLALGRTQLRRRDTAGADRAALQVLDAPRSSPGQRGRAWRLRGDAAWLAESTGGAGFAVAPESCYAEARRLASSTDEARACEVILDVLRDPTLRRILGDYLTDTGLDDAAGLARLATARIVAPDAGMPRYLLGRRLFFAGDFAAAGRELEASLGSGDLGPEARLAAADLLGQAQLAAGDPARAVATFEGLLERPLEVWRRRGYEDWERRSAWRASRRTAADASRIFGPGKDVPDSP